MPRKPPSRPKLYNFPPEKISKIISFVMKEEQKEKYRHWDILRHLTPPEDLTREEWWFAIKMKRQFNRKNIHLNDCQQSPFSFAQMDTMLESLHSIDLKMGGGITLPEPIINPQARNDFIVRSLIEEAITSSQLEGASTTRLVAKKMLQSGRKPRDKHELMIYNNYLTMERIREIADQEINKDLILELHRLVTEGTLEDPATTGRFRLPNESVVVEDTTSHEIIHQPPDASELPNRIQNLCDFANGYPLDKFLHPVLRAIIVHFWLAYDHPFVDGNGRTARALFYWTVLHHKYWLFEFISISEYLLKAPVKYARSFLHTETDDNDLNYFIFYQLGVIEQSIQALYDSINKKTQETHAFEANLKKTLHFNHRQESILLHALKHPWTRYTIKIHKNNHRIAYDTARNDLLELEKHKLLYKKQEGNTFVFIAPDNLGDLIQ